MPKLPIRNGRSDGQAGGRSDGKADGPTDGPTTLNLYKKNASPKKMVAFSSHQYHVKQHWRKNVQCLFVSVHSMFYKYHQDF